MHSLFHFSDDGSIVHFEPRQVKVPAQRKAGFEWLNTPLVWAIDEWHQPMYLFPRECPRILIWRNTTSNTHDVERYFGNTDARMIAYIEKSWESKLKSTTLFRYEFPVATFESLSDAGMWVSKTAITPTGKTQIKDLPDRLGEQSVELRTLDSLTPLHNAWTSSLHVSGIRLRNAQNRLV